MVLTKLMYSDEDIKLEIKKYTFYHKIKIKDDIFTRETENEHFSHRRLFKYIDDIDLRGKKVLDIGCRDGIFSFYAEKKGAKEIVAIDNNLSKGAVNFLIPYFNSKVKMYEKNLYELTENDFGKFDVIFFFGVLYHLREPITAIRKLSDILNEKGLILCETATTDNIETKPLIYIPFKTGPYPEDPTSCAFFNTRGLEETFNSLNFEIILIEKFIKRKFANIKKIIKNFFWLIIKKNKILNKDLVITNRVLLIASKNSFKQNRTRDYWYGIHKEHQK